MRTFTLVAFTGIALVYGSAMADAAMRGGGSSSAGGHAAGNHGAGSGRHHGAHIPGARPGLYTYDYGGWDPGPQPARAAAQGEYRAPPPPRPPVIIDFDQPRYTFGQHYTQAQWLRHFRRMFRAGNHYARHRAMPGGSIASIEPVRDVGRRATPMRRVAAQAPQPVRYSRHQGSFTELSSR